MKLKKSCENLFNGKGSELLMFIGLGLVLLYTITSYSNAKDIFPENLVSESSHDSTFGDTSLQQTPDIPAAQGDALSASHFARVPPSSSNKSTSGLPPSCSNKQAIADPSELLPTMAKNKFSALQPTTNDLKGINLLQAGYHIGVDTVGQSLRNANLQLRSEPPNPQTTVGPWMNTTIEPDVTRKPFEIGCKC